MQLILNKYYGAEDNININFLLFSYTNMMTENFCGESKITFILCEILLSSQPFCVTFPHALSRNRTLIPAVRNRRPTAKAMT
jgi:hypothetical protein